VKMGDLVRYTETCDFFQDLGIIIGGPEVASQGECWKIWWIGQHNDDGSTKMGWWDDFRLEVISEEG